MIFKLLGSLGLFLYGMRIMSDGVQKTAGEKLQRILGYMTKNRVIAVVTGFIVTGIIQSSSATTVMVISFVNASLLNLTQAIGVIMGANIGTTVTTWIVSFFGFKFNITAIALPIIGIGFPFFFSKRQNRKDFGEILVGFGLLFLGLAFLKNSVPDINEDALAFLQNFSDKGFLTFVIFVTVGAILTVILESSSAAMAITVTMAYKGYIGFEPAAAIVLGENIGTTVKAFLVSIGTNVNARRAARAHFMFNVMGVIWMAFVFKYFLSFVMYIAPWDATLQENLPLNLSLFHTTFNLTNTFVFIWFVKKFAILIRKMVPEKETDKHRDYKLQYISTGLQDTAQLNILNAKNETTKMAQVTDEMFTIFLEVYHNPKIKMGDKVDKIKTFEELTDQMQEEITQYLVELSKENLTEQNAKNLNAMMRIVNELESIGDSCYKLSLIAKKKYDKKIKFHSKAEDEFNDFVELISELMGIYKEKMNEHLEKRLLELAYKLEGNINNLRDNLKKSVQYRLQKEGNVKSELLYLDLLKHLEHIGDNSLNIAQALRQVY